MSNQCQWQKASKNMKIVMSKLYWWRNNLEKYCFTRIWGKNLWTKITKKASYQSSSAAKFTALTRCGVNRIIWDTKSLVIALSMSSTNHEQEMTNKIKLDAVLIFCLSNIWSSKIGLFFLSFHFSIWEISIQETLLQAARICHK